MNRDLLDALAAVSGDFYLDALHRYPALLRDREAQPDDEALVVWRVLMALDELVVAVQAAREFDDRQPAPTVCERQETLPF